MYCVSFFLFLYEPIFFKEWLAGFISSFFIILNYVS